MKTASILTPYLIPREIAGYKKVNLGDGIILDAITRLLRDKIEIKYFFSTRKKLNNKDLSKINSTELLIIAGANQLNDHYTLSKGSDIETVRKIKVPIIFLGVGYAGEERESCNMSQQTKEILKFALKSADLSSWRCFRTVDYLKRNLPEFESKYIMTSCPVVYGDSIMAKGGFEDNPDKPIVLTITDRGIGWFSREVNIIKYALKKYKGREILLVLHQDFSFGFLKTFTKLIKGESPSALIRLYAKFKGVKVVIPQSVDEAKLIYESCDRHLGSRLHAHLFTLSMGKKSFLAEVDDRARSFSDYLDFPIINFSDSYAEIERLMNYDFENYRKKVLFYHRNMVKFIDYLERL